MGEAGQGLNNSHQQKKMDLESLKTFRKRFKIPVDDNQLENLEYIKPDPDSPEVKYAHARRQALGGYLPSRPNTDEKLEIPALDSFSKLLESSGDREFSSTMAFVRMLSTCLLYTSPSPRDLSTSRMPSSA